MGIAKKGMFEYPKWDSVSRMTKNACDGKVTKGDREFFLFDSYAQTREIKDQEDPINNGIRIASIMGDAVTLQIRTNGTIGDFGSGVPRNFYATFNITKKNWKKIKAEVEAQLGDL